MLAVLLCLYLLFNKGGLTRGKTLQRRRGASGGLYVFYYECYVARVEGVYLSGGVGEVMTHYVGRSVEGDEGVVVADGMSVERLVCGGGDGGVGDHVVVVVEEPDAVSGERHTGVGP